MNRGEASAWSMEINNKMEEQTDIDVYEKLKNVWKYEEVLF